MGDAEQREWIAQLLSALREFGLSCWRTKMLLIEALL